MINLVKYRLKYRPSSMTGLRQDPAQTVLPGLTVEPKVTEGMGVLSDGIPFLTQRGLAAFCGVQNAHIGTISREWTSDPPRVVKIKEILAEDGLALALPHIRVMDGSREIFAYPAEVCAAVIEYYAFLAPQPHCWAHTRRGGHPARRQRTIPLWSLPQERSAYSAKQRSVRSGSTNEKPRLGCARP